MTRATPLRPPPIGAAERSARADRLSAGMAEAGLDAVLVGSPSSLKYFAGFDWHPSERLTAALIHADGRVEYVTPGFERDKIGQIVGLPGDILTWEEHESPYALVADRLAPDARLGVDDQVSTFTWLGLLNALGPDRVATAGPAVNALRRIKSADEIALMQYAKTLTLEVHRRAWASLEAGARASEVVEFIDRQHRAMGGSGSSFCIVSFGTDTSLPHGGEGDPALKEGDVVLIDTGTPIDGYSSDITRTYVFGEPTADHRRVWNDEKAAQQAAFEAAVVGATCESVDAAARDYLTAQGYGPDYALPGLPHRTGHGIGLDIHEAPNLVRGDTTPLAPGMCFSNEPMLVIPGQFGVRLEDHIHITQTGARWFTEPSHSIDEPFKGVEPFDVKA